GSTSPSLGNHSFDDGEIVTLEAIPEDGWVFDEWEGDKIHTNSTINITMDENIQITANFEKEEEKDKDDIPGFLLIKLLLCIAISMVVYGKKKR
ncbi:MAG: InlB B-repeat-containing protein, partial [Candidatus Saliniplasma sp.]